MNTVLRNIADPLLLLGLAVFLGEIGARLFQRLRIPQVVGYIAIGILLGRSGLGVIPGDVTEKLRPFNLFALGIIGFVIGGELKLSELSRRGTQFITILLMEGMAAFTVVGILTGVVTWYMSHDWDKAVAIGLLLGAISSATAPAATVSVLWEYRARGPLTSIILGIVALDDGLALFLYGFAASMAGIILGHGVFNWKTIIGMPVYEIGVSVVVGSVAGLLLNHLIRWVRDPEKQLVFCIGMLLLTMGLATILALDQILVAMALGFTLVNLAPRRSLETFSVVKRFAPPIYVLFFVLAGARLNVMSGGIGVWVVAVTYLAGRTIGKIAGAYWGTRMSQASKKVRKYLGVCLMAQAGVAVGLSILAAQRFADSIGEEIVLIIAATTFMLEIIGPPCVKFGIVRAGEAGLGVTEEDLVRSYDVKDVMEKEPRVIHANDSIDSILNIMSRDDKYHYYPVVDDEKRLKGVIGLDGVKPILAGHEAANNVVLAYDLMEPVREVVMPDTPLQDAITMMQETGVEFLPVVESRESRKLISFLDIRALKKALSAELLRRNQAASKNEEVMEDNCEGTKSQ